MSNPTTPVTILSTVEIKDLNTALITAALLGYKYVAVDNTDSICSMPIYAYHNQPQLDEAAENSCYWTCNSSPNHPTKPTWVVIGSYTGNIPWQDTLRCTNDSTDVV